MGRPLAVYGKYQLLERIARGGMAEVFKAKSHGVEGFEKVVVIKRILPELSRDEAFVSRFINEAKLACRLSHRNIVQVFDLGRAEGTFYIAMEYVDGADLATVMRTLRARGRLMPVALAAYIAAEAAKGLAFAHGRHEDGEPLGIVHCDISPQNILLSQEGEVKITDFGIATANLRVDPTAQPAPGKFAYMPPEQVFRQRLDARADVFSLGVVLYEALTGECPMAARTPDAAVERLRDGGVPLASDRRQEVPEPLAQLLVRAMAFDVDQRPGTAQALHDELVEFSYREQSGRRVGPHELSDFIEELLASRPEGAPEVDPSAALGDPLSEQTGEVDITVFDSRPGGVVRRIPGTIERREVAALTLLSTVEGEPAAETVGGLVRRFGGLRVDRRVVGDDVRIVIFFGTRFPDTFETDAAAHCALRLSRVAMGMAGAADRAPSVRIGLHRSAVDVARDGQPLPDRGALALMEGAAEVADRAVPGQVALSPVAQVSLQERFDVIDGEGVAILAGERPFAALGARFVGRRDVLRSVGDALSGIVDGQARLIVIAGEPGSGKSRLMIEVMRRLRRRGHGVGTYVADAPPRSASVPYSSIQAMTRRLLGIDEWDPAPMVEDRIGRLREVGLRASELAALQALVGHGGSLRERRLELPTVAAFARLTRKLAHERLSIFGWDDWERVDPESRAAIEHILRTSFDAKLAILITCRAEDVEQLAKLPAATVFSLGAFSEEDVARQIASHLNIRELPLELLRHVAQRSQGSPLSTECFIDAMVDVGAVRVEGDGAVFDEDAAAVEVPGSLSRVFETRLRRLPSPQQALLRMASLLGTRFSPDVMGAALGEGEPEIAARILDLVKRRLLVRSGPGEYGLAHDMVRDAALNHLPAQVLVALHGQLADAIESLYPGRTLEIADHRRGAGQLRQALALYRRAGIDAEAHQAVDTAVAMFERAIQVAEELTDPTEAFDLYTRFGALHLHRKRAHRALAPLRRAVSLAERLGREPDAIRCRIMLARLAAVLRRDDVSLTELTRAQDGARVLRDPELTWEVTLAEAEVQHQRSAYRLSAAAYQRALALLGPDAEPVVELRCLSALAVALATTGETLQATRIMARARSKAAAGVPLELQVDVLISDAVLHLEVGSTREAAEIAKRGLTLAEQHDLSRASVQHAHLLGAARLGQGDYQGAFRALRQSYDMAVEHGYSSERMLSLCLLGFIDAVKLGSAEGRSNIVTAITYADERRVSGSVVQGLILLGLVDACRGDRGEARVSLGRALSLAQEMGHRRFTAEAALALERLDAGETVPLPGDEDGVTVPG